MYLLAPTIESQAMIRSAFAVSTLVVKIASGRFADEWDDERVAGHPSLRRLRDVHASAAQRDVEDDLRRSFEPRPAVP